MSNKSIYIILLGLLAFLSSCKKDDDGDNLITRNDYLGEWICTENGGTTFPINITKKGISDTIIIDNFSGYGPNDPKAMAIVSGGSMNIPNQNITNTAINIFGTGILNSSATKITMNYHADGVEINATCIR